MNHFGERFRQLTGHEPLAWQIRLYNRFVEERELPKLIDLPTGLGKTMVMAIWLIARENNPKLPRRLVYVVDRRTVVDQATDIAIKLQSVVGKQNLAISTLRGQLADNREWSQDPTRPAIVIGTVDLIGSALLFSGYRSSYKRRPLEAGLLGQDSLLVLDEAHLSKPFEKLICDICDTGRFQKDRHGAVLGTPMKVIRMSATSSENSDRGTGVSPVETSPPDDQCDICRNKEVFRLCTNQKCGDFDLKPNPDPKTGEESNQIIARFTAKKTLSIIETADVVDFIGTAAEKLENDHPGARIVLFVRTPKLVDDVRKALIKKDKSREAKIAMLTGTMRGLERDELVEKPVMKRFLDGEELPGSNNAPVFLISTSAGEVGFDLNADHMVCDATTMDSLIQRLGRVNRRGKGDATIQLFVEVPKTRDPEKEDKSKKLEGLPLAISSTIALLRASMNGTTSLDVSPKNIAALKKSDAWSKTPDGQKQSPYDLACAPSPTTVELTDILLDNWSMTSITEPMPGRPDVAPWLRGIDEEQAQTTVAWRAELDLFRDDPSPEKPLQAIFARHPIRPHESLTVNTRHLIDEFLKKLGKLKDRPDDLLYTRVAIRLPRGQVVCRSIEQLIDDPGILFAESTLILPARFGGLDNGLLSVEALPMSRKPDEPPPDSLDVADQPGYEPTDSPRSRLRLLINRDAEHGTWTPQPLPGGVAIPDDVQLDDSYETSTRLFNALKDAGFRVRLVQPVAFDEDDNVTQSLVMLAPASKNRLKEDQSLAEHVAEVESQAQRIADQLQLTGTIRDALLFAARWHDEGKKALIWQRFANGPMPDGQPKGKTAQARDPKSLKHYRHEFGSLLRVHHPDRCDKIDCTLPADQATRDLALHLIATHHGGGRPHFPEALYDPFTDDERDQTHTDAIRRFARLQRHFGWWTLASLENLLRCADQLASASAASDTEEDETEELA